MSHEMALKKDQNLSRYIAQLIATSVETILLPNQKLDENTGFWSINYPLTLYTPSLPSPARYDEKVLDNLGFEYK